MIAEKCRLGRDVGRAGKSSNLTEYYAGKSTSIEPLDYVKYNLQKSKNNFKKTMHVVLERKTIMREMTWHVVIS